MTNDNYFAKFSSLGNSQETLLASSSGFADWSMSVYQSLLHIENKLVGIKSALNDPKHDSQYTFKNLIVSYLLFPSVPLQQP